MEDSGLQTRKVCAGVPPRVIHTLAEPGRGLAPVPGVMRSFGKACQARYGAVPALLKYQTNLAGGDLSLYWNFSLFFLLFLFYNGTHIYPQTLLRRRAEYAL